MKPIYWGIFVPNSGGNLDKVVIFQHVTFGFRTKFPEELYGKTVDIIVNGYGNNKQNEAYSVKLPNWVSEYYNGAEVPHITLSTSRLGKPVDSWKLDFCPIKPFVLEGLFGYFDKDGVHM